MLIMQVLTDYGISSYNDEYDFVCIIQNCASAAYKYVYFSETKNLTGKKRTLKFTERGLSK